MMSEINDWILNEEKNCKPSVRSEFKGLIISTDLTKILYRNLPL